MAHLSKVLTLICLLGYESLTIAQTTIPASGNNGSGSGGTISYTVGQVVYTINVGTSGAVNQGVQQPYEITVTGIEETKGISLEMQVYPNPTPDIIKLLIKDFELQDLSYQIFDINGKLLRSDKIENIETEINMSENKSAIYFLKIFQGNKEIKTFKIIKN